MIKLNLELEPITKQHVNAIMDNWLIIFVFFSRKRIRIVIGMTNYSTNLCLSNYRACAYRKLNHFKTLKNLFFLNLILRKPLDRIG
jgi:hypothetical protein